MIVLYFRKIGLLSRGGGGGGGYYHLLRMDVIIPNGLQTTY